MRYLFIIALLLLTSGCAIWPEHGQGGWSENYLRHKDGNESLWYTQSYAELRRDLEHLRIRLELMQARGIEQCMPAKLKLARLMLTRVTRELSAKLYAQAEHDLEIFYHQVNLLQTHFTDIKAQTGCGQSRFVYGATTNIKTAAEALLNSDNQFAYTDNKITPKYQHRIHQAVDLLKSFTDVSILLVGHTDAVGGVESNQKLGIARAEEVKQALQQAGLSHAEIITVSKGETAPYAENTSLANRLANRRVDAKIIDLSFESSATAQHALPLPLKKWTHNISLEQEQ